MAVHRAEPRYGFRNGKGTALPICYHCDQTIKRVPGGQGPTWVHEATGTVVGSGAPDTSQGESHMTSPRNAEIVRRLRSNAHTMRALGEQNGIQAEFDFADLLDAACEAIDAGERDATALDMITEILNDNEWNGDIFQRVANHVWATGRVYEDRLS